MSNKIACCGSDALIIVDMQKDFCDGGALSVPGANEIISRVNKLATYFDHVILTQDWHPPRHISFASSHAGRKPFEKIILPYGRQELWPDHCVQNTSGADFHDALSVPHAELIFRKGFRKEVDTYSAFFEADSKTSTGLNGYLHEKGFKRLFLAGLAFDFCVRFTAEDAVRCGFISVVIEDACRAISNETREVTLRNFNERQILCTTSEVLTK